MKKLKTVLKLVLAALFCAAAMAGAADNSGAASVLDEYFPDGLVDVEQKYVDAAGLDGKIFALYFSASWCRGCAAFSRILVPFRNRHQEKFEVVLIGFDYSTVEMHSYMKNYLMLWPAVAWDSPVRLALKERFKVSEIPTLIVIAPDGRIITTDGYKQIESLGDAALENWLKIAQEAPITD